MPFLGETQDFWGENPLFTHLLLLFGPKQKKRRERSVKHRLHETGGKSDGKSAFFGEISGKRMISKIPVFPLESGKFQNLGRNFGRP